jgi:hypothetical protein
MKTINGWRDLEAYGLDVLTGEACGVCYRLLLDVTAKGRDIIRHCLDLPELKLSEPWNSGTKESPHIGSIMLAPELFVPISVFALLDNGCKEVWLFKNSSLLGIEPTDDPTQVEHAKLAYLDNTVRYFRYGGDAGSRNTHQMSGRVT